MKLNDRFFNFFRSRRKTNVDSFANIGYISEENKITKKINKEKQNLHPEKCSQACYDIEGERDLLIVNISKFVYEHDRYGSEEDVDLLRFEFQKRDFELFSNSLNGHVSYQDFQRLLDSYLKSKRKPKLFAIAIMSHGVENDYIEFSDGELRSIYQILKPIFIDEKLSGVPKLIIGQFCRGTSLISTGLNVAVDSVNDSPKTINGQADTLFYFATAKGNLATRDPKKGSPFIKEFCKIFRRENNLWNMSIAINRNIAEQVFRIDYEGDISKYFQIPVFCHTFTKNLVFEKNDPAGSEKGK